MEKHYLEGKGLRDRHDELSQEGWLNLDKLEKEELLRITKRLVVLDGD